MPNDRELDQLIDAALPGYAEADPRPGFEQRILANALAERRSALGPFVAWALTVSAIGCLLLFMVLRHNPMLSHHDVQPLTGAANIPDTSASPVIAPDRPSDVGIHLHSHKAAKPALAETPVKREVFPTPSPLTDEECRVVALSQIPAQLPAPPNSSIASSSISEINPIRIAELQITPLEVKTLDISDSTQSHPAKYQP
jgi:hypothetical protein